jgi:hypothetical protein
MTKLELTVETTTLDCISLDKATSEILGAKVGANLCNLLADDEHEVHVLRENVKRLDKESFATFNLVFAAPNTTSTADRSPIHGVFCSPIRAIHTCGEEHLACFVRIEHSPTTDKEAFHLTALEYSRSHRESLIKQEFGSWLLEEHVEQAVIGTDATGNVVVSTFHCYI